MEMYTNHWIINVLHTGKLNDEMFPKLAWHEDVDFAIH